ncbi:hypothetical protein RI367_002618 [Sorochytrium milnesiophthora]
MLPRLLYLLLVVAVACAADVPDIQFEFLGGDARLHTQVANATAAHYDVQLFTRVSRYKQEQQVDDISRLFWYQGVKNPQTRGVAAVAGAVVPVSATWGDGVAKYASPRVVLPTARSAKVTYVPQQEGMAAIYATLPLLRNHPDAVSVISDVDDTIRETQVLSPRAALENTFLHPWRAPQDMRDLFQYFCRSLGHEVAFHYVSGGPHQLQPAIESFLSAQGYPAGGVHLRQFYLTSRDLWGGTQAYKVRTIAEIMRRYDARQWVLLGDSTEHDPAAYAQVYREMPPAVQDRIRCIYIRVVEGTDVRKEKQLNHEDRFEEDMQGVPRSKWVTFKNAAEIGSANIRAGVCGQAQ